MPFGIAGAIGLPGLLGSNHYSVVGTVSVGNLFDAAQLQQYLQANLGQENVLRPMPAEVYSVMSQPALLPQAVEAAPPAEPTPHVVLDLSDAAEIQQPKIVARAIDLGDE